MSDKQYTDKEVIEMTARHVVASLASEALDKFGWKTSVAYSMMELGKDLYQFNEQGELDERDYDRIYITIHQMIDGMAGEAEEDATEHRWGSKKE